MSDVNPTRLISAKEAETQIPTLNDIVGNELIRSHFQARLKEPFAGDANVMIEGLPGTGKTNVVLSYLRQRFQDPNFEDGDVFEKRKEEWNIAKSSEALRTPVNSQLLVQRRAQEVATIS
jgi:Cdc6-like AAA superfamily ATPase